MIEVRRIPPVEADSHILSGLPGKQVIQTAGLMSVVAGREAAAVARWSVGGIFLESGGGRMEWTGSLSPGRCPVGRAW